MPAPDLRDRFTVFEPTINGQPIQVEEPAGPFTLLADLLDRPELLEPPELVVPIVGYRARTVVLAAPDKSGKSTLTGDAIACLSAGRDFLGQNVRRGRALLVGLEEHVGDAVRRFAIMDPDPSRIELLTSRPADLFGALRDRLTADRFDLVVVDSLQEYARAVLGKAPDDGDNAGWSAVVRPLVQLSRDADAAFTILHHVRRSDGKARGATEIFAAVDATLEMERVQGDTRARRISGRARWPVEDVIVRLGSDGRYLLASDAPPEVLTGPDIETEVCDYLKRSPGASRSAVRSGVNRKAGEVDRAVDRLEARGTIRNLGDATRHRWWLSELAPELGS